MSGAGPALSGWRKDLMDEVTGTLNACGWSGPVYHQGCMPHSWDSHTFTFAHPVSPRTLTLHLCPGDARPTVHVNDHTPNRRGHPQKEMRGFVNAERFRHALLPTWRDPLHVRWHDVPKKK